ncbi:hypothetical protein KY284_017540 [Solanum tuberosum]|nr:hypothetical protein KY284_017540 [Solanum tuberosum]
MTVPHKSNKIQLLYQQGIRPKMYVLNSVKSFIVEEEYIKKYILKCPVRLNKCTMDIRVITNPNSKNKYVVLLVPTLVNLPDDEEDEEPPKMSLMIWNCRGSDHPDFRISFRSMLDYYGFAPGDSNDTPPTPHE